LQTGDDDRGYTQLTSTEYEKTISEWADNELEQEAKKAEAEAAKESAQSKLAALGLTTEDLKALVL